MRSGLLAEVRQILDGARQVVTSPDRVAALIEARARLDGPLRVAIAGKVKAGKSTLLNALVGEQMAPTDAGECTRIVTWYRQSHRYLVEARSQDGSRRELPYQLEKGRLTIDLGGLSPGEIDRLEVSWPSAKLNDLTLIDTPGLASLSTDVSARTLSFLGPDVATSGADAVLYLMRHLHENDLRFLEAFRDSEPENRASIHRLGVLSRADEIGGCTASSLDAAERVADRWRADPRLRRLCQTVIPVAGLLAQAGTSLREDEFLTLRNLASVPVEELEAVLLSADRVRSRRLSVDVDDEERRQLLERLGLLGIRLSVGWIRSGRVTASPDLARALVEASGLGQLREALARQFEFRSQVLKARSGLVAADVALAEETSAPARQLRLQLQRIQHGAHEIVEIDLLNRLRSDVVDIPADYAIDMERLLGGAGPSAAERLGLVQGTANAELTAGAADAISRYRRLAVHPLASRTLTDLADAVVRSCEGLLADLRQSPG